MKDKVITFKIDPETEEKLNTCIEYYKKQNLNLPKSEIIRLAIHCLWEDVKD